VNDDKTGLEALSGKELEALDVDQSPGIKSAKTIDEAMSMMSRHHRRKAKAILRARKVNRKNRPK
jgi:hypothetical protein